MPLGTVAVAVVVVLAAVPGHRVEAQVPSTTVPGPDRDVRAVYQSGCAMCHGPEGRGTRYGPTLVGAGRASLHYQLSTGRMPLVGTGRSVEPGQPVRPLPAVLGAAPDAQARRHRPAYSAATIAALVDFVDRLTGGGGPDTPVLHGGSIAEGVRVFGLQCAACHAWSARGGALLHVKAPTLRESTARQVAEAVRVGPGQMPAFGSAALTDRQLASLVAYVEYLRSPQDRGGQALWHLGPFAEGAMALVAIAVLLLFASVIGQHR